MILNESVCYNWFQLHWANLLQLFIVSLSFINHISLTRKAGKVTIFGLAGTNDIEFLGSETDFSETNTDLLGSENEDSLNKIQTGILGFCHAYYLNKNTY